VTKVVVDASAGVEIAAETASGRALGQLLPASRSCGSPSTSPSESGAVLPKWGNGGVLSTEQLEVAVERLLRLPVRRAQLRELFRDAWTRRHNMTFGDAPYVGLAVDIGAALLTGDHRLAAAPTMPVPVLHLSRP